MKSNLKKILYIDDDEDILAIAKMCFESFGHFNAVTSTKPNEVIQLLEKHEPDLVLLDVMMPEIDGIEVLNNIRSDSKFDSIPIVFISAKVQQADIDRFLKIGALGVITKPFDPLEISNELSNLWDEITLFENDAVQPLPEFDEVTSNFEKKLEIIALSLKNYAEILTFRLFDEVELGDLERTLHQIVGSAALFGHRDLAEMAEFVQETIAEEPFERQKLSDQLNEFALQCGNLSTF